MISLSKMLDRPIARDGRKFDVSLLWMVVLMTVFSLIMIYSASIVYAASEGTASFLLCLAGNLYPVYGGHMLAAFPAEDELLAADCSVLFCCFGFAVVAGFVCRPRD